MESALKLLKTYAEERGKDFEALLLELVAQVLDPPARVEAYLEASEEFWREGLQLVERGDVRQGGEKIWNAVVQMVKAYAESHGLPHDSHRLIWAAVRRLSREEPRSILLFAAVEQLHVNFYEGHLEREDVEKLVEAAAEFRGLVRDKVKTPRPET
ncbi:MAG: PaREP1 family protein [Thermoproteus sp.]